MAWLLRLPLAPALLLSACSPSPPSEVLPGNWTVLAEESIDSIAGTITTSQGVRIDCDIGLQAGAFREPVLAKCNWHQAGLNPDFYAWRRSDDPNRVHLRIRNLNPESGAFCFDFIPWNAEDAESILQQLLVAHEEIRVRLLDHRRGGSP